MCSQLEGLTPSVSKSLRLFIVTLQLDGQCSNQANCGFKHDSFKSRTHRITREYKIKSYSEIRQKISYRNKHPLYLNQINSPCPLTLSCDLRLMMKIARLSVFIQRCLLMSLSFQISAFPLPGCSVARHRHRA